MAEAGIGQLLECAVCTERVRDHRVLPCQHIFCLTCLEPLVRGRQLVCPLCRAECTLKPGGVTVLPKSPLLVGIVDLLCAECLTRNKEMVCAHCQKQMCRECHSLCRQSIEEEINNLVTTTNTKVLPGMDQVIQAAQHEQHRCREQVTRVSQLIKRRADDCVTAIRQEEKDLQRELEQSAELEERRLQKVIMLQTNTKQQIETFLMKNTKSQQWRKYNDIHTMSLKWKNLIDTTTEMELFSRNNIILEHDLDTLQSERLIGELVTEPFASNARYAYNPWGAAGRESESSQRAYDYAHKSIDHTILGSYGTGQDQMNSPSHVAVSPLTGNYIVADSGNHRIHIIKPDGRLLKTFGSRGNRAGQFDLESGSGVAVTRQGHIVISDTKNNRLQIFTEEGDYIKQIGSKGEGLGEFEGPNGIACHDGNIYVCESCRVQILDENGVSKQVIDMCEEVPFSVAVAPNGDIFVVMAMTDGTMLVTYGPDGSEQCRTKAYRGFKQTDVSSVAVDNYGNVLIAVPAKFCILDRHGKLLRMVDFGHSPGSCKPNHHIVCAGNGKIILTDGCSHELHLIEIKWCDWIPDIPDIPD